MRPAKASWCSTESSSTSPSELSRTAFDLAKSMACVKDLAEILQLQKDHWEKLCSNLTSQAEEVRALSSKVKTRRRRASENGALDELLKAKSTSKASESSVQSYLEWLFYIGLRSALGGLCGSFRLPQFVQRPVFTCSPAAAVTLLESARTSSA